MNALNVVYRFDVDQDRQDVGESLDEYRLVEWTPSLFSIVPANIAFERRGYIKNWFYHFPRIVFRRKNLYLVYVLMKGDEVLSQCLLTPASVRYRFMKRQDLQFGLVFTSPDHRNKRLANLMVGAILARNRGQGRSFWWITEADNLSSRKVAERVGFRLICEARRKSVLGLSYYTLVEAGKTPGSTKV